MKEVIIQIRDLTKRFGSRIALDKINLTVSKGEIYGIIGMSGAGKSTLIRCLACLEKPSAGEIFLMGEEISHLLEHQRRGARQKMGMIFQHFNLFSSRSALENVVYPLEIHGMPRAERRKRGLELLDLVGLAEKSSQYPEQLSGGEKQRVAIARALANHPLLLLCDEATSALDPHTTHSILELLRHLNDLLGLTIFLITHEMEVIKQICTHVAVLDDGKIVEQGSTLDLFATPNHPITKKFLQNVSHELPENLQIQRENVDLVRLSFTGKNAAEPIMCRLIREYQVDVNILLGGIDYLRTGVVGNLVITLSGPLDERAKAVQFLENSGVKCLKI